jgi:hypothetical protein
MIPPARGMAAFSSDSKGCLKALLRTLNKEPDQATVKSPSAVLRDEISLFVLVIMSPFVFNIIPIHIIE